MKNEFRDILNLFKNNEVTLNLLNNVFLKLDIVIENNKQSLQFLQQLKDALSSFDLKTSFIADFEKESAEVELEALKSKVDRQILERKIYE